MRDGTVRSKVSAYLVRHLGEICHVDTIASETGLRRTQVQSAVNSMIGAGVAIEISVPGNAWRFTGPARVELTEPVAEPAVEITEPAPAGLEVAPAQVITPMILRDTLYEEIGTDPSGFVILRDTEGCLWQARRLA